MGERVYEIEDALTIQDNPARNTKRRFKVEPDKSKNGDDNACRCDEGRV